MNHPTKTVFWALSVFLLQLVVLLFFLDVPGVRAQTMLQYGFETREPIWVKGAADAPSRETVHRLTEEYAHEGQRSEWLQLQAEKGTFIHYTYDIGRAPIRDELNVSLWVKSNRPGIQLLARAVLPREPDPRQADQRLTILIPCDTYQRVGRWHQLALHQPVKRLREQQQLLRAQLQRDIVIADAYIDRLVLNVYGGPGQTDVYIDDLEVGPIEDAAPSLPGATPSSAQGPATTHPLINNQRAAEVTLRNNQLFVGGQKFFLRGIRHTGTPLKALHLAGFNTVWLDETAPPGLIEDAVNLGFWIIPSLRPPTLADSGSQAVPATLTSRDAFGKKLVPFLNQGPSLLSWDLGDNLAVEQFTSAKNIALSLRSADPGRPLTVDVYDGFLRYSRNLDQVMLGIHRWPLMTTLELPAYREWLVQRRQLAQPGSYCWTWVQTHLPDWFTALAYDRLGAGPFNEPIGPHGEQIRLLAYTAIAAGYRGLGFWSDRFLADTHTGRDRLLSLAILNQELQMLEPLLVGAEEPAWIDTSSPYVKAAIIRSEKAVLVLPMWVGPGSQYVPGQSALAELKIIVPQVPGGCQAWEVSPGLVRSLNWTRVVGGMEIKIPEFGLTSAIVFTADLTPTGLVVRFQDQQRRQAKIAAQYAHDQAAEELTKAELVNAELVKMGHSLPDGAQLLEKTKEYLESCKRKRRDGEWSEAYLEAQRALRPLRILMRAHWEKAVRELDTPVASPYAVSFYTLPRHYRFMDEINKREVALGGPRPTVPPDLTQIGGPPKPVYIPQIPLTNVLPDGDFEAPPNQVPPGWLIQEVPSLDDVVTTARRVAGHAHHGKQGLMLQIVQKDQLLPPVPLERTFLAIHSPAVKLPPGTLVRITAWVQTSGPITHSPDGALLYDSAGGEPLAVRIIKSSVWKRYALYRTVPASGAINVTLALTGLGIVYFDDVRIEPLLDRQALTSLQP